MVHTSGGGILGIRLESDGVNIKTYERSDAYNSMSAVDTDTIAAAGSTTWNLDVKLQGTEDEILCSFIVMETT
jgi:hypothetical protein